jgi:regulator of protease activity HflC (stomatin/prohibitin superfamily)
MMHEVKRDSASGIVMLLVLLPITAAAIVGIAWAGSAGAFAVGVVGAVVFAASAKLKVNDKRGNPVEIATVVVWKVVDTAEAAFHVDNYENYVLVQSEAALRNLATGYPYDAHREGEVALSSHTAEISAMLTTEIQDRLQKAGVEVIETRVSHLAYSPEIAAAMLRRQQAAAVVAARQTIVEGAVGMVENALDMLAAKKVIDLDEERKATMVSNLLVVLCSEQNTQPVVNTGSLYR